MTLKHGPHVRVLLVDDQDLYRRGLAILIAAEGDIEVVGEAASGAAAVSLTEALTPDVVLLDLGLTVDGASVQQTVAALRPLARVLMLVDSDDEPALQGALDGGADGYLLKRAPIEGVAAAVRAVTAAQVPPS